MSGGELAEACRRAADDDFIVEEDVTRLRTLLRDAAATLERWEPIVQAEPTSIECAWCSEPIDEGGMGLHSGCTLTCPTCGRKTVLDVWKPEERARFYTIVERAREPSPFYEMDLARDGYDPRNALGPVGESCKLCGEAWHYAEPDPVRHAPDCPLKADAE